MLQSYAIFRAPDVQCKYYPYQERMGVGSTKSDLNKVVVLIHSVLWLIIAKMLANSSLLLCPPPILHCLGMQRNLLSTIFPATNKQLQEGPSRFGPSAFNPREIVWPLETGSLTCSGKRPPVATDQQRQLSCRPATYLFILVAIAADFARIMIR